MAWNITPGGARTDRRVIAALGNVRRALENLGCRVVEEAPEIAEVLAAHKFARAEAAREVHRLYKPDLDRCGPEFKALLQAAERGTFEDLERARRIHAASRTCIAKFFEQHDFMVWPTTTGLAFDAELPYTKITEDWRPVELTPLLGLPAISIPVGQTEDGLPAGLQIIGRRGDDAGVLRLADRLECCMPGGSS